MRWFLLTTLLIGTALAFGCRHKEPPNPPPPEPVTDEPAPFVPPSTPTLSAEQVAAWQRCNASLDSLSIAYKDSFATENTQKRREYERNFVEIQSRICVRRGLEGGYPEYAWVMKALAHPINKDLRDSLDIQLH